MYQEITKEEGCLWDNWEYKTNKLGGGWKRGTEDYALKTGLLCELLLKVEHQNKFRNWVGEERQTNNDSEQWLLFDEFKPTWFEYASY